MNTTFLHFFILTLAVWRLASLFANEEGPFDIFVRLRYGILRLRVKNPRLREAWATVYKGLRCEWCNSVWFGFLAAAAWWYFGEVVLFVALPLALSAGAIGVKYAIHILKNVDDYYRQMTENHRQAGEHQKRMSDQMDAMRYSWGGMDWGKKPQ